jgi:parallel beta-helix repeat protein
MIETGRCSSFESSERRLIMKWLCSRTAAVALVAVVAALAICLGTWQGWLAQASPAEVYVNDNLLPDVEGCNNPDASNIPDGITAADPGDTVIVCEGTYAGGVPVGKSVTIEGRADAARSDIIVQGGSGVDGFTVSADDVTIRHMLLDGVDASGTGIHVTGNGATIQDVEAMDWVNAIWLDGTSDSVVEYSEVDDNNLGIWVADGENNVIRNNLAGGGNAMGAVVENEDLTVVTDNDLSGSVAALYLDADAPGILNVRVARNTINAASDGILIDVIDTADSLIVIGGRLELANTFSGSPDHTAGDYFIELTCGSEATVAAIWNYWPGIATRSDIADLIFDDEDQNDCGDPHGAVVFHPWATEPAPAPSPSPTPEASPSPTPTAGTRTFDLQQGWNNFVWTGATGTDPATVLGCIDGSYAIAYHWDGSAWTRYVPDDPAITTLTTVDKYDSLLVLVTDSGVQCQDMPVEP